jgi:hypothetical protein
MKRATLYRKFLLACLTLSLVVGFTAISAASVQADEVFQPRHTVGPYAEGKHSAEGLVDIIQGEGWQLGSCIDEHLETGAYVELKCAGAGNPEEGTPHNNGYARVWNKENGNNEIWGWARF